jgi:hypothetical protein
MKQSRKRRTAERPYSSAGDAFRRHIPGYEPTDASEGTDDVEADTLTQGVQPVASDIAAQLAQRIKRQDKAP